MSLFSLYQPHMQWNHCRNPLEKDHQTRGNECEKTILWEKKKASNRSDREDIIIYRPSTVRRIYGHSTGIGARTAAVAVVINVLYLTLLESISIYYRGLLLLLSYC